LPLKLQPRTLKTNIFGEHQQEDLGAAVTDYRDRLFVSGQWEMRVSMVLEAGEMGGFFLCGV